MQEYLLKQHVIENQYQLKKRDMVLNLLRVLIPRLITVVSREYNLKRDDFSCQLVPFGSYGVGAHLAQSDMDLVFLGAMHVRRRDFFHFFPPLLKDQATVNNVEVIDNASVPIIRCTVDSVPVDISFVRLRIHSVPADINLADNLLLTGLDDTCKASLDGPRVNQFVLQQIQESDLPLFRTALQSIKHWAQQRAIYDKHMGYLGGHAWTLLLLKTYMTNTISSSTDLLRTFFHMWSSWPWPAPVLLTDFIPNHDGGSIDYHSLAYFEDAVMPIVTPCYRVYNAASTVKKATLKVLTREFSRAYHILASHPHPDDTIFNKLFKPIHMLARYLNFITVIVSTDTYNTHEAWLGKMPAVIPRLIEYIESVPEFREVRPYTKPLIRSSISFRTKYEKLALQNGLDVDGVDNKVLDLEPGVINRACYLIGVEVMSPNPGSPHTIDISSKVALFRRVIDSKESDLVVNIVAGKRKEVARLIQEHQL